ncbi:MAG: GDSL-type esterase/lipase family protein [Chitinophagaceae bacterium]
MFRSVNVYLCIILYVFLNSCSGKIIPAITEPNTAKVFSSEIDLFDKQNASIKYDPNAILFTGSSTIRLWLSIEEDMAPYKVIQRGFGGARIEDLAWYFKRIVYPHQFSAIAIFAGTNNITGNPNDTPVDTILHYTKIINRMIRQRYHSVPIFWIAITPVNSRIKVMNKVHEMNEAWKKEFSKEKNIWFIDTENDFLRDGKPMGELFNSDQLHLNREGYRYWSKIVKAEIEKHLNPVKP